MSAGYDFVPLPGQVRRMARPQAVFDRRIPGALSGTVHLTFVTQQPIHIGTGFKRLHNAKVVRAGTLVLGRPGIPGSSLKGVIRSRYEAITLSCAGRCPEAKGDIVSQSHPDVKRAQFAPNVRKHPAFDEHGCSERAHCPACALFGRMSLRSRLTVADCLSDERTELVIEEISEQFAPRPHHVGDFAIVEIRGHKTFEIRSLKGRKFALGRGPVAPRAKRQYIEVIPQGVRLRAQLRLLNVVPEELGGLLAALGRNPSSALKVGGGKCHGFGRLVLQDIDFHLRDHAGASAQADEPAWRLRFEESPDRFPTGETALVKLHQGDC